MSPHQILHTEIIEPFVVREVGNGPLQDTLKGGIWAAVMTGMIPRTGLSPPDLGIGKGLARVMNMRRIILRDLRIVMLVVVCIVSRAERHLSSCW